MTPFETSFRMLGGGAQPWWRRSFQRPLRVGGWLGAALLLALPILAIVALLVVIPIAIILFLALLVVGFVRATAMRVAHRFARGPRGMSEGGRENVRVVR